MFIVIAALVFFWIKRKKKAEPLKDLQETKPEPTPAHWLQPAVILSEADDKTFYTSLRNCIWNFLSEQFNLRGSKANKGNIMQAMHAAGIEANEQKEIVDILEQCEAGIFINADTRGMDKMKLLERAKLFIERTGQQIKE